MNIEKIKFQLDKNSDQHLYIQLYSKIKKLILDGTLKPHTKLPPIRKFADELNVNNVTIVNAYNLLQKENLVYKKVGSGTFVNIINYDMDIEVDYKQYLYTLNKEKINHYIYNSENIIDFSNTTPTNDLFPVEDFKYVINLVLDRDKGNAFKYQESQGYYPLRETIKNYLSNYTINCDTSNIQIISGAQQGIDILSKALIDYGDIVFTESPTYTGAIAAFKSRAAKIIEIPIKKDGIDLNYLEDKLRNFRPKFIYVMPNFQNPTGYTYSKLKKIKLLELANKYETLVVEDDYLNDISFNNKYPETLKSLDKNNRVIYIKSFSKTFMPGLRLGFMIIPISIQNEILVAKHISDISTSGLMQRVLDLYIKMGLFKKHINEINKIYKKRFDLMVKSLSNYIPKQVSYSIPEGGLNFWLSLPHGYLSDELHELCFKKGILITPGSIFYANKVKSNSFRISIASVNESIIEAGISRLSEIINDLFNKSDINKYHFNPLTHL
ncbi:transcriptional regulator [Caloranaerobacter sp. TR13]|uniref:MocR-like pyridoxine biosynthesis transcription factor PdxR n=1 Tax=Caloranaerobacter sp. TR13 TaxID=1302151 RepID=UPI0006D3C80B|nr:PLP-dependent aminotransferase family protein [Caloranaerobacter sp. TR13]KPU28139.1 transcriptional regulator [Caloranaerobacter sp. TR13]